MDNSWRDLIEFIQFIENVSAKIHGLLDEAEICRTVVEEFAKSGRYAASIFLLTDDETELSIACSSLSPEKVKAGEEVTGFQMKRFKISLNESATFSQVVRDGKTLEINVRDTISEIFPPALAHLISEVVGYDKIRGILTPLRRNEKIIGALGISSTELAEFLIPSVKTLAQHISTALELAEASAKRKQAEEMLQQSERTARALLDASSEAMLLIDKEGTVLAGNKALAKSLGKSLDELLGSCIYDHLPPDVAKWRRTQVNEAMRTGKPVHFQDERASRHFDHVIEPILDVQGNVEKFAIFASDITTRKQAEAKLIQIEKLASLEILAGGIAHELRNPLGIISLCAQKLQSSNDARLHRQCAEKIYLATQRASQIIENLLGFAHPQDGPMTEVDVQGALEEILDLLDFYMTVRRTKLQKRFQPSLPKVHGNPKRLQQVFINLILNACNAMPDGGTLTVTTRGTQADEVEIQFSDTGHGIRPEHLPRIFDPFFTTMPVGKGVGLGLSTSYSIIQQHRGTIEVQSQVGNGATFTIRLPGIANYNYQLSARGSEDEKRTRTNSDSGR